MKTYGKRMQMPFPFRRNRTQNELQSIYGLEADNDGYVIARPYIRLAKYDTSEEEM